MIVNLDAITTPQELYSGKEFFTVAATGVHYYASLRPNTAITSVMHEDLPRNSTVQLPRSEEISRKLRKLLEVGKDEIFEDGMESNFSKGLIQLILEHGNNAVSDLAYYIVYEKAKPELSAEALRWLGLIDHPGTYGFRLWVLERSLQSSQAPVRDAAALGLSFLDDPHAIPYLRRAIEKESVDMMLHEDLQQVLDQLESTARCHSS
jgi:hypothetical protein